MADPFFFLPDGATYEGAADLAGGSYVIAYHGGRAEDVGEAHRALVRYARKRGLRDDLPRYEIACLKLLDREDGPYRCTVEMRAVPVA